MSKTWTWMVLMGIVLLSVSAPVLAQPASEAAPAGQTAVSPEGQDSFLIGKSIAIFGACVGAGFAAVGGGYGIARIGQACIESIARQPEAAGAMFAPMIITAAMVEGGMLFAIVVCLLGVLYI